MASTTSFSHTLHIGDVQLNLMDHDTSRVIMPDGLSSYHAAPTSEPMEKPNTIYIVLQHSKSAGKSKLLLCSKVTGVFQDRKEAIKCLHGLKDQQVPVVRKESREPVTRPEFWCTSSEPDEEEGGFQNTSTYGEAFFVWVEEHELQTMGEGRGGDVAGKEQGDREV
jgi:hypothetical protein